jgi:hypothetical protein
LFTAIFREISGNVVIGKAHILVAPKNPENEVFFWQNPENGVFFCFGNRRKTSGGSFYDAIANCLWIWI